MASPFKRISIRTNKTLRFAIVLIVAVVAAELAAKAVIVSALGISRATYDSYYLHDDNLKLLTWSYKYSPHPYFGYESAAIRRFEAERYHRSKKDYVIGVLGGSVAEMFAYYAGNHPEVFEPLRTALPELRDKRLVIANLALGGGHQPQQYFIAAFFLDDVDLFISIEGFNDVMMMNNLPVYPIEFPSVFMRVYERTSRGRIYRWLAAPLTATYQVIDWLPLRFPLLSRSSLYFSFWYLAGPTLYHAVRNLEWRYYTATIDNWKAPETRLSSDDFLERKVQVWRRYALLRDALVNGNTGKRGFVFLQPNQYLKGSKQFSQLEKTTAVDPVQFQYVLAPMQRLKEEFRALNEKGVRAYDLTDIFRETTDTVYIDRCCHVNGLGNEIMAKAIVSRIINAHN